MRPLLRGGPHLSGFSVFPMTGVLMPCKTFPWGEGWGSEVFWGERAAFEGCPLVLLLLSSRSHFASQLWSRFYMLQKHTLGGRVGDQGAPGALGSSQLLFTGRGVGALAGENTAPRRGVRSCPHLLYYYWQVRIRGTCQLPI